MAKVLKQDSNVTSLRYAVEDSPGHVPSDAVWYPLEPNSYKTFGGTVKTKARMPINASRQLKKAVVVDLDASVDFQQDLTPTNSSGILQSFFYAAFRTKGELAVATVDGTGNAYEPISGGDSYFAGDLLFAKDFDSLFNTGKKTVTGFPVAANIPVTDTAVVDGATQKGTISRVGFAYGSGELSVDVAGPYPRLIVSSVAATSTLTTTGVFSDSETITIGGHVYTFKSPFTGAADTFDASGTTAAALTSAATVINARDNRVTATSDSTKLYVTAKAGGAIGNAITTAQTTANATWGSNTAHLTSGTGGRSLDSFGLIPGEFIFIGGDDTNSSFAPAGDNGFCRVRSVAAGQIEMDKTQGTMVISDGAGKSVQLFFGRVLKNESNPSLIVKRSVQLERTLGAPDDAQPSQIQAEYVIRSLGDNLDIDMKTADIIRLNLQFLGNKNELRDGPTGVKAGTRVEIKDTDAFNSTSDVAFTKMAIVTAGNAAPTPLFSFFTDLMVHLKNNIKQNKAVSVLGAFDSTLGFFQVTADLTGYFVSTDEMQAVLDNKSITVETHMVKFNSGISIDLPLVVLSKAIADVKINEPILIPLASDASTAKSIDINLDHTMLWIFWDFLPSSAG